jgi:predicted dehydrogenase
MPSAGAGFTILGSGFGLYGYLPALIGLGVEVVLPLRYRPTLERRPELSQYLPKVVWCADADEALAKSGGVIVAVRPADQSAWIPRLAAMPNIGRLVLEKPVAPDPQAAACLLATLEAAGKRYRVGYMLRLMPWAQQLRMELAGPLESVRLDWNFLAHHYRTDLANWKRFSATGGGALRFFGIHLIALLAELGYDDVSSSTVGGASDSETERWEATFTGRGLCPFALRVDSRADDTCFRIVAREGGQVRTLADQRDPFSGSVSSVFPGQDLRVGILQLLYRSFDDADELDAQRQKTIVALWACVERKSRRG